MCGFSLRIHPLWFQVLPLNSINNKPLSLTIKLAVPLGKSSQKELAVLFDRFEEVPLTLEGQRLLHLAGAAGVVLGTEPQVLTWKTRKVKPGQERKKTLGSITRLGTYDE